MSLCACDVILFPLLSLAPDEFDAVSVQNVGSTYIIVSWDLPTDSNIWHPHQLQFVLQWCSGRCPAPYCDQLQHHRPPPLHFVHVHVCLLCYCVQHAQITVCMVHVYDLCSVRYLLDRSSSHTRRHCTPIGMWCWASSVLQPACPGTLCTLQSLSLCSIFLCSYPSLLPFFLSCLTYSLPPSLTFSLPHSLSPVLL